MTKQRHISFSHRSTVVDWMYEVRNVMVVICRESSALYIVHVIHDNTYHV